MLEAVGDADVLDEVGRVREADLAGPVVEDLEAGRARDEVDAVATEVGVRLAVAGVERERARGVRDGALDDVPREQHPLARRRPSAGPASSRRRRISGPRISMPTSASTRLASSTIRPTSSGARMLRLGRTRSSWANGRERSARGRGEAARTA